MEVRTGDGAAGWWVIDLLNAETADNAGNLTPAASGTSARIVGLRVVDAVRTNRAYVITHPKMRPRVVARFERLMAGFHYAEAAD